MAKHASAVRRIDVRRCHGGEGHDCGAFYAAENRAAEGAGQPKRGGAFARQWQYLARVFACTDLANVIGSTLTTRSLSEPIDGRHGVAGGEHAAITCLEEQGRLPLLARE